MYNFDLFNWRLTNPSVNISAACADYLDLVSGLCQDDVLYYRRTIQKCDVFDVVNMLDWFHDSGLVSSDTDRQLWQASRDAIVSSRRLFMTAEEVESRLKHAEGHCPFCGFRPSFSSEPDSKGFYHCISHCGHFRFNLVQDIEGCLRRAKTWDGARWPYSWDRQVALADGTPLLPDEISSHCQHCRETDAKRVFRGRVLSVLKEMAVKAQTEGWAPHGWGGAFSVLRCGFCNDGVEHTGSLCKHQEARLEQWASDIVNTQNDEYRLNGAGLKLYTRGLTVGFRRDLGFNMRVGGDQAAHYPHFVAWANARLAELKLTEDSLAAA